MTQALPLAESAGSISRIGKLAGFTESLTALAGKHLEFVIARTGSAAALPERQCVFSR